MCSLVNLSLEVYVWNNTCIAWYPRVKYKGFEEAIKQSGVVAFKHIIELIDSRMNDFDKVKGFSEKFTPATKHSPNASVTLRCGSHLIVDAKGLSQEQNEQLKEAFLAYEAAKSYNQTPHVLYIDDEYHATYMLMPKQLYGYQHFFDPGYKFKVEFIELLLKAHDDNETLSQQEIIEICKWLGSGSWRLGCNIETTLEWKGIKLNVTLLTDGLTYKDNILLINLPLPFNYKDVIYDGVTLVNGRLIPQRRIHAKEPPLFEDTLLCGQLVEKDGVYTIVPSENASQAKELIEGGLSGLGFRELDLITQELRFQKAILGKVITLNTQFRNKSIKLDVDIEHFIDEPVSRCKPGIKCLLVNPFFREGFYYHSLTLFEDGSTRFHLSSISKVKGQLTENMRFLFEYTNYCELKTFEQTVQSLLEEPVPYEASFREDLGRESTVMVRKYPIATEHGVFIAIQALEYGGKLFDRIRIGQDQIVITQMPTADSGARTPSGIPFSSIGGYESHFSETSCHALGKYFN